GAEAAVFPLFFRKQFVFFEEVEQFSGGLCVRRNFPSLRDRLADQPLDLVWRLVPAHRLGQLALARAAALLDEDLLAIEAHERVANRVQRLDIAAALRDRALQRLQRIAAAGFRRDQQVRRDAGLLRVFDQQLLGDALVEGRAYFALLGRAEDALQNGRRFAGASPSADHEVRLSHGRVLEPEEDLLL